MNAEDFIKGFLMKIPTYLYKILSVENWRSSQSQGFLHFSSDDDAFIHLATKDQVGKILKKFWVEKPHVVLKLETDKLIGKMVFESNPGGTNKYYHLYDGKVPLNSVVSIDT